MSMYSSEGQCIFNALDKVYEIIFSQLSFHGIQVDSEESAQALSLRTAGSASFSLCSHLSYRSPPL